ncbi:ankyrin repeat protein, partial [Lactarius deliciosus]
ALYNQHIRVTELLYQHGAVLYTSYRNRTLLHATSTDGLMDVVKWLLDIDADANAKDNDHRTPLHLVAAGGHLEVVRTLLGYGVDVNATMTWGDRTPLYKASSGSHVDMVRLLIENGA